MGGRVELTLALTDEFARERGHGAGRGRPLAKPGRTALRPGGPSLSTICSRAPACLSARTRRRRRRCSPTPSRPPSCWRAGARARGGGPRRGARSGRRVHPRDRARPGAPPRRPPGRRATPLRAGAGPALGQRRPAGQHSRVQPRRERRGLARPPAPRAELARHAVGLARDQGAFGPLAHALDVSAGLDALAGRWREAYGHASEGLELARAGRCAWAQTAASSTWHGWMRCRVTRTAAGSTPRRRSRWPPVQAFAASAPGRRSGSSSSASGAPTKRCAVTSDRPGRAGRRRSCRSPGPQRAPGGGGSGARAHGADEHDAVARRCAALLADATPSRSSRHGARPAWRLRRVRPRAHAAVLRRAAAQDRPPASTRASSCHAARDGFEALGARPWAERAAADLRATGERLGRREARQGDELTPQELQVALQAAEGKTNKEIGAALFLSPKTVHFHLRRVFRSSTCAPGELIPAVRRRRALGELSLSHFAARARHRSGAHAGKVTDAWFADDYWRAFLPNSLPPSPLLDAQAPARERHASSHLGGAST